MSAGAFDIDAAIRKIPDHPHPGILFYDLMPLFQSPAGHGLRRSAPASGPASASRAGPRRGGAGLILGGALAQALGVDVAAARKSGRLPCETVAESYTLEYGTDAIEVTATR